MNFPAILILGCRKFKAHKKKQMAVAAQLGKDGQPVVSPEKSDRRFSGEKWRNNPFFFLFDAKLSGKRRDVEKRR